MRIALDVLREYPILSFAARKAGIGPKTLARWIERSEAGHEGYDLEWRGEQWRFHDHCQTAIDTAHDALLLVVWQLARGIQYKTDPLLVKLGYQGVEAFATDKDGNFIEEIVGPPNLKMVRVYLEWMLLKNTEGIARATFPGRVVCLSSASALKNRLKYLTTAPPEAAKPGSGSRFPGRFEGRRPNRFGNFQ